ncbi:exopolyphosphatase [Caldisalinibacter kiritimatiensis]|uniref:Exopolyphosphatase n=1 Tax=Caldisalinibacter kiritimatiensis TaxID=1304284 RepID=R1AXJ6_9FIRM|nr:exopolyphosphatase [Caldisalinibacter kiritimatiensis]EOD01377.1 Exopolyphosphatase [Caldisalinibacter kiritimatiensis]
MCRKLAIIDLGSNSIRVIIMRINNDGSYIMLDQAKEMVRLSEGMGKELTLKSEPINRTIHTLKLFKKLIQSHSVDEVHCITTAAVRRAKNRYEFLKTVKKETGLEFRVISGEKEAYYDYLGVINTIDIQDCIMIDVGGASTEIAWIENRLIKEVISLPFGAVILTEDFLDKDIITKDMIKNLENYILEEFNNIKWLKKAKGLPIIGVGGTIRTIAKVDKKKIKFPLVSLHNYKMNIEEVSEVYKKVTSTKLKDRKKIPGVSKDRADIIAGGIAPVKCLIEYLESENLIISGNGLREGIFFENYLKDREYKIVDDVLINSVENILKRYDTNLKHSYHVQKLALSLFDQTKELHALGENERKLLAVGALLHDIGMFVDYYNHHKHGFYLTLNSRPYGLENRELVICAYLVAMHRDKSFKESWRNYKMLIDKEDYNLIKKLSIFIKMAEKLDRSEYGNIKNIDCSIDKKAVNIKLNSTYDPELEIVSVMKFEKDFKKLFGKKMNIYRAS